MKKVFLFFGTFLFAYTSLFAFSTKRLTGVVLDSLSKSPIEFANVLIFSQDSLYIDGCTTTKSGSFVFEDIPRSGGYLKVSFIGYVDAIYSLDSLSTEKNNILYLRPSDIFLEEITVSANRKPFQIEDERILFNPSFVAYAVNASDLIRQAPGVMDTGTSLVMPGKNAIKIYINNKEQKGSLEDILLLLKSYPASEVESIEVMINPSTRYTMGQNVGVIHVKLKKKPTDYLGGNASYSLLQNIQPSNEGSLGLFYQGKRFSTSLNTAGNLKKYDLEEHHRVGFTDYTRNALTDMTRHAKDLVLRWNMNYQFNENWNAGLSAYYATGKMKQRTDQHYCYYFPSATEERELITGKRTDQANTSFASFDLEGKLSKTTNLTINVDYYHKHSPTERSLYAVPLEERLIYSLDDITSDNVTAKVNLNLVSTSKLTLNFGVDGIFTNTRNSETGVYSDGLSGEDDFEYQENEINIYGEARYKFNSKWMLRGSLRYQSIWTEAENKLASENTDHHYQVFCPAAFLSYLLKENQSLQLGFYYNINKPTLTALNPSRLYIGNDTYRVGNPELEHSTHYVVSLSYSLGSLMIQPYIEWLDNGITEISRIEDNKYQVMTWENAVDRRNLGLMIFWAYSKPKWMRASLTAFLTNPVTTSDHPLLHARVSSFKFSLSPNLQFYLENDRKWILAVYGNYTSREHTVDLKLESMWRLNASLTWKASKQWTLSASGLNLLRSHTRGIQYIGESTMKFNNKYMYTGFQFSASFTWGKSMRQSRDRAVLRNMNMRTELD